MRRDTRQLALLALALLITAVAGLLFFAVTPFAGEKPDAHAQASGILVGGGVLVAGCFAGLATSTSRALWSMVGGTVLVLLTGLGVAVLVSVPQDSVPLGFMSGLVVGVLSPFSWPLVGVAARAVLTPPRPQAPRPTGRPSRDPLPARVLRGD